MSEEKNEKGKAQQQPPKETQPPKPTTPPIPPRKPGKRKRHLIPDETIQFQFGMQPDDSSENDEITDTMELPKQKKPEKSEKPVEDAAAKTVPAETPEKRAVQKEKAPLTREELERRKKRITLIFLSAICIIVAGLILWLVIPRFGTSQYDNNMSGMPDDVLTVKEGYPLPISGTEVDRGNFWSTEGRVMYVSDTSIVCYDNRAKEQFTRSHSFYHPIARHAGKYTLVYHVGNNGFQIEGESDTIRSETAEASIMAADIAENGKYAIVTETKGYASYLAVYHPDGALQYTYRFANCYVSDIALSEDGTRGAVIGVTAKDGALISEVYLLNFSKETPEAKAEYANTMLLEVAYCGGRALAVGDNLVASVAPDGSQTQYEYEDRKLAAYDFSGNRVLVALSPYDTSSRGHLTVLDQNAQEICTRECPESFTDAALFGDTMALLSKDTVYAYSVNAVRNFRPTEEQEAQGAFASVTVPNDASAIALADESAVYVLGVSEVRYEDFA